MTENPLSQFTTQVGMYVTLPSGGRFYDSEVKLTADGDVEVFPMNAMDEMQFQNPDGLLNNEALVKVLTRTIPGITNAREIPKPDLDVLLLGLRMATYGKTLDVDTKCVECGHEDKFQVNLTQMIATVKPIPEDNIVKMGELTVHVRPYSLTSQNKFNEYMINVQRTARMLAASGESTDIERVDQLKDKMADEVRAGAVELFRVASDCIDRVVLPDETVVTDKEHISQWLNGISAPEYGKIKDKISYLSEEVINREIKFECSKCNHLNQTEMNFDPANFFDLN